MALIQYGRADWIDSSNSELGWLVPRLRRWPMSGVLKGHPEHVNGVGRCAALVKGRPRAVPPAEEYQEFSMV